MSIQNLPSEILLQILKFVNKKDVYTCLVVCKSWYVPSVQTYYEELALSPYRISCLRSMLFVKEEDHHILLDNLHLVKKLFIFESNLNEYDNGLSAKFETEEFLFLLSYCDNLKTLDFCSSNYYDDYMAALLDLDSQYLTMIEEICKCTNYGDDELYFLVCFKFRRSLNRLSLTSFDKTYRINGLSGDCLSFITLFKKLTDLSVHMKLEDLTLLHFLELCPDLISIEFKDILSIVSKQKIGENGTVAAASARTFDYSRRLRSIKLCFPMLREPHLSYLECYPTNYLETLHIDMYDTDFYSWMADYSIKSLKALGKSMSSVKNLVISTRQNSRLVGTRIVETRFTTSEMKMTRFFLFVGAIKGNRNLYCDALYEQSRSPKVFIQVEGNQSMSLIHTIGNDDYSVGEPFEHNTDPLYESFLPLPDSKITLVGPEIINSLWIVLIHNPTSAPPKAIKYALRNCPYLETLKVGFSGDSYFATSWLIKADAYEEDAKTKSNVRLKVAQQNLTHIKLETNRLTKDLKEFLAANLPNINTLSCQADCEYIYLGVGEGGVATVMELLLDLRMFKNLNVFSTQLDMLYDKKYCQEADHYIFVKFCYPDIDKTSDCYRIIERNLKYKFQRVTISDIEDFTAKYDDPFPVIVITYELNKAIDSFTIYNGWGNKIASFHLGELVT